jgi:hypothetical protein
MQLTVVTAAVDFSVIHTVVGIAATAKGLLLQTLKEIYY